MGKGKDEFISIKVITVGKGVSQKEEQQADNEEQSRFYERRGALRKENVRYPMLPRVYMSCNRKGGEG